ncbi:MAG: hypothetical protein SF097_06690, partial [Acidobacteriota bacterium]|nr:hypothetical protein [Acidobacteriota bacterium]
RVFFLYFSRKRIYLATVAQPAMFALLTGAPLPIKWFGRGDHATLAGCDTPAGTFLFLESYS